MFLRSLLLPALLIAAPALRAQRVFTYVMSSGEALVHGIADSSGNVRTIARYNSIGKPVDGICRVMAGMKKSNDYENARAGYCRANGEELVAPTYLSAEDFSDGMGLVSNMSGMKRRYGFVDARGKLVVATRFNYARSFSEGLAAVQENERGEYVFIDKYGLPKLTGGFQEAISFSEGLAAVAIMVDDGKGFKAKKYGYIDKTGKMVIPAKYIYAGDFKKGYAVCLVSHYDDKGQYGSWDVLIDKTGKEIGGEQLDIEPYVMDGHYAVKVKGKNGTNTDTDIWALMDTKGTITAARFNRSPNYSEGLALFESGGKMGYMDRNGKVIVPARYKNALYFKEGLAPVQDETGKWGFINTSGAVVIKPQYFQVGHFSEGLAAVRQAKDFYDPEAQSAFVDKTGKIVIPFGRQSFGDFVNGKAMVTREYVTALIDKKGNASFACDPTVLASIRSAVNDMGRNDIKSAIEWLKPLKGKGCIPADYWLGYMLVQAPPPLQDTAVGLQLLHWAAKGGMPEAMYNVGYIAGMRRDFATARRWMQGAADKGLHVAWVQVGQIDEQENKFADAALHYQKAADQGDATAMFLLAQLYSTGKGVAKNENKARELLAEAAARNFEPARRALTSAASKK